MVDTVAPWRIGIWSVIIGTEFSVKHDTSHCRLCREVSSFDSLLVRSLSKKIPKFAPRSRRNTCCEYGRRPVMVVFAAGVPLRARRKFWHLFCVFWKRHRQKRIKWWTLLRRVYTAKCHVLLNIQYQWWHFKHPFSRERLCQEDSLRLNECDSKRKLSSNQIVRTVKVWSVI